MDDGTHRFVSHTTHRCNQKRMQDFSVREALATVWALKLVQLAYIFQLMHRVVRRKLKSRSRRHHRRWRITALTPAIFLTVIIEHSQLENERQCG